MVYFKSLAHSREGVGVSNSKGFFLFCFLVHITTYTSFSFAQQSGCGMLVRLAKSLACSLWGHRFESSCGRISYLHISCVFWVCSHLLFLTCQFFTDVLFLPFLLLLFCAALAMPLGAWTHIGTCSYFSSYFCQNVTQHSYETYNVSYKHIFCFLRTSLI